MKGFKITNLITNIIAFLYSFLFCGLIGGFSLLELFVGSWGKNDDAISESLILLLSSAVIILHGFLLVIFGGYAYSKWKNNPKPYLKCHLFLSISGIACMGILCLIYTSVVNGPGDTRILNDHFIKGEFLYLVYIALCALELLLTILSHITGNTKQVENLKQ